MGAAELIENVERFGGENHTRSAGHFHRHGQYFDQGLPRRPVILGLGDVEEDAVLAASHYHDRDRDRLMDEFITSVEPGANGTGS